MGDLLQDVRYGLRMLAKNRGFTAVAVLTLALGIGANTAIFSVVNAVLLNPLPYEDADRLVMIEGNYLRLGMENLGASPPEFFDYQEQGRVFDGLGAFNNVNFNLTGGDQPERIVGARVSAGLFGLLGAEPVFGRVFLPGEFESGRGQVVVLSYGLWQRRFGSDPAVLNKTLALDGDRYTVVGVMPRDFQFPHRSFGFAERADLWVPLVFTPDQLRDRSSYNLRVIARLQPGLPLARAQAQMATVAQRLEMQYPHSYRGPNGEDGGWRITVVPLRERVVGHTRKTLSLLLFAAGVVLLIACANIAHLLLARAVARRKEIAIRTALGATRRRLARQLLIESLLLALLGGVGALLLAAWGNGLLVALNPASLPRVNEVSLDPRVLGFTLLLSLLTGLVFGLAPVWHVSRVDLAAPLNEGSRGGGASRDSSRFRHALVVSEYALAMVLLVAAGLLIRSFLRLTATSPGFNPESMLTMRIALPPAKYPDGRLQATFFQNLLERLERLPGVRSAGATTILPLTGGGFGGPVSIEDRPFDPQKPTFADYRLVSSGYFRTMSVPLIRGRWFTPQDQGETPSVVVISETLARIFFPGEDPLGKRMKLGAPGSPRPWRTIVGVAGDVNERALGATPASAMYVPYLQEPTASMALTVRTGIDSLALVAATRGEVQALDKDQPVFNVQTMEQVLTDSVSARRFSMLLLSLFAGLAMLLATVGIYGVMTYAVSRRTQEIGVRRALGASRRDVLTLVLGQGLRLALVGVGIGMAGAWVLTRFLTSLLYGVRPTDPATLVSVASGLLLVSLLACYIPARRATKVDPLVALRYE